MWGETHISPRRRPTLYGVSLSRPTDACVRRRYSLVTDVVPLYALIICHINDGSRLPSLLIPQLKSVMFTFRTAIRLSVVFCCRICQGPASGTIQYCSRCSLDAPDVSEIAVLSSRSRVPHWLRISSFRLCSSALLLCSTLASQKVKLNMTFTRAN